MPNGQDEETGISGDILRLEYLFRGDDDDGCLLTIARSLSLVEECTFSAVTVPSINVEQLGNLLTIHHFKSNAMERVSSPYSILHTPYCVRGTRYY
jgi:hypothetical protein